MLSPIKLVKNLSGLNYYQCRLQNSIVSQLEETTVADLAAEAQIQRPRQTPVPYLYPIEKELHHGSR